MSANNRLEPIPAQPNALKKPAVVAVAVNIRGTGLEGVLGEGFERQARSPRGQQATGSPLYALAILYQPRCRR